MTAVGDKLKVPDETGRFYRWGTVTAVSDCGRFVAVRMTGGAVVRTSLAAITASLERERHVKREKNARRRAAAKRGA